MAGRITLSIGMDLSDLKKHMEDSRLALVKAKTLVAEKLGEQRAKRLSIYEQDMYLENKGSCIFGNPKKGFMYAVYKDYTDYLHFFHVKVRRPYRFSRSKLKRGVYAVNEIRAICINPEYIHDPSHQIIAQWDMFYTLITFAEDMGRDGNDIIRLQANYFDWVVGHRKKELLALFPGEYTLR